MNCYVFFFFFSTRCFNDLMMQLKLMKEKMCVVGTAQPVINSVTIELRFILAHSEISVI